MALKLHELLAIKSGVMGKVTTLVTDLVGTLRNKPEKFKKKVSTTNYLEEGKPKETTTTYNLETTVAEELAWIGKEFAKALNINFQIQSTNCDAKSDIVVDGKVLVQDAPATYILELEKHLLQIKGVCEAIPNLEGAAGFELDKNERYGVSKSREVVRSKTSKKEDWIVVVQPTQHHPANVQKQTLDITIGSIHEVEWSGLITSNAKAKLLGRIEDLLEAVKQAQARANAIEVKTADAKPGQALMNHIFGDLVETPLK